jgi:hypothetical protein
MSKERLRHLASWCFTVGFETAAGLLAQLGQWTVVTLLFWAGLTALAIGYWPEIYARVSGRTIFSVEFIKDMAIYVIFASAVYWITMMCAGVYSYYSISPPRTFRPEAWALRSRVFVTEEPEGLTAYFRTYTDWRAKEIVKDDIGRWYAITGIVSDVTPFPNFGATSKTSKRAADVPYVNLQARSGPNYVVVGLLFQEKWNSRATNFSKGERIRAYCVISGITSYSVSLANCQVVDN